MRELVVWELQCEKLCCGGVALWWSHIVEEAWCVAVAMWGSCFVGETQCGYNSGYQT